MAAAPAGQGGARPGTLSWPRSVAETPVPADLHGGGGRWQLARYPAK